MKASPVVAPGRPCGDCSAVALLRGMSLLPWKRVQLPRQSVSRAVSLSPRLNEPKGAARKSGSPHLSGLMSKMFQSAGNLLQSGIRLLFTSRTLERRRGGKRKPNEREEKWYLAVGSDRSTFLRIDM